MLLIRLLILLLCVIPVAELYVLIQVGTVIGTPLTVALVIITAAVGFGLVRWQGLQTLRQVEARIQAGQAPAQELLAGLLLLVAGITLLTPGFVTDAIGFALLVPPIRAAIADGFLRRLIAARVDSSKTVIIEGEFTEEQGPRELP